MYIGHSSPARESMGKALDKLVVEMDLKKPDKTWKSEGEE
jgi:hypothetical protein